jgi:hypothetical protein
MSPFSKVEMSLFVVLKWELQHERYGAGGAPTTNEPTRTDAAGSNSTSQAQIFHGGDTGSIPVRDAKAINHRFVAFVS